MPGPSTPLSGAQRQARYRARKRYGVRLAQTDLDPDIVAGLVERGLISPEVATDPRRLGDALADIADCLIRGTLTTALGRNTDTPRSMSAIWQITSGLPSGSDSVGSISERLRLTDTVDKVFFRDQNETLIRADALRRNIDSCIAYFGF